MNVVNVSLDQYRDFRDRDFRDAEASVFLIPARASSVRPGRVSSWNARPRGARLDFSNHAFEARRLDRQEAEMRARMAQQDHYVKLRLMAPPAGWYEVQSVRPR